jgi:hypothetical protein
LLTSGFAAASRTSGATLLTMAPVERKAGEGGHNNHGGWTADRAAGSPVNRKVSVGSGVVGRQPSVIGSTNRSVIASGNG